MSVCIQCVVDLESNVSSGLSRSYKTILAQLNCSCNKAKSEYSGKYIFGEHIRESVLALCMIGADIPHLYKAC